MATDAENRNITMENPPSPFKVPSLPGTPQPLQPISSERQNQQRLPQSPSLPLNLDGNSSPRKTHQHRLSDASEVKARIAYLNAISQTGSPTRPSSPTKLSMSTPNHAAVQRAMLGREEAEATFAALTAQIESSKARERLVSERVESLMEQLTEARNRQRHERAVYEKEIKHSKKSEYKAELAVIKLQEDLREVRGELEGYKARSDHEKTEKEKARQDAFERAYVVAGMTEEIQDVRRKLEVAEQERDAAVAMAASKMPIEQEIAARKEIHDQQEVDEKIKQPTINYNASLYDEMDFETPDCPIEIKFATLQREADFLRRQLQEQQETVHFMNMQCQFRACPCRLAERDGVRFVHDYKYDAKLCSRNAKKRKMEDLASQPPLPIFRSWRQEQKETKGKQPIRRDVLCGQAQLEDAQNRRSESVEQEPAESRITQNGIDIKEPAALLPPSEVRGKLYGNDEQTVILEEAANIPLPSLHPMEIDSTDDSPEATAQLEELTQVIVEPGTSAKDFLFSTSTTSDPAAPELIPLFRQSHTVHMSDDLFDISPPKRHIPPRPSTAMGVLTVESPLRLVPNSPQVFEQHSTTPGVNTVQPMMTRIALNDTSPVSKARQQKPQPRPIGRDRSRGRSPAPQRTTGLDQSSPASSTLFPITPATKHERIIQQQEHLPPRPQTTQDYYPSNRKEISTTTIVPLRGDSQQLPDSSIDLEQFGPTSSSTPFSVPGTPNMTREQALAQIRARRDRARSVNMRKPAEDGSKTPGSVARRGVNLKDRLGDARGRDFSQASAPGRI